LRIAKAVSTYKSQGMTVGEGQTFAKVVIGLPRANHKSKTPGLEQTAFSRAKDCTDFAIADDELLTMEQLLKIGTSKACEMRRNFELRLKSLSEKSMEPFMERIKHSDPSEEKDFDQGVAYLVQKFRKHVLDVTQQT
jgi:hypothetical protein